MINNKTTLALCLLFITNILASSAFAQNCTIADIAGTWTDGSGTGVLNANGTFQTTEGQIIQGFTWAINGNSYTETIPGGCRTNLVVGQGTVNSSCNSISGIRHSAFANSNGDCGITDPEAFVMNKVLSPPVVPPASNVNMAPITSLLLSDSPNERCANEGVFDCKLNCIHINVKDAWVGDNFCDDGAFTELDLITNQQVGVYLNCSVFNNDGGDCG